MFNKMKKIFQYLLLFTFTFFTNEIVKAQNLSPNTTLCEIVASVGGNSIQNNETFCKGTVIDFSKIYCNALGTAYVNWTVTNVSTGNIIYTSANTLMSSTFSYLFNSSGVYSITYYMTNGSSGDIPNNIITVNIISSSMNASNISFLPSGTICYGTNICFNASSNIFLGTNYSGTIDFGDGTVDYYSTSGWGQNLNPFTHPCVYHQYANNGTYLVTLTCTTACNIITKTVNILVAPSLPLSINGALVCNGSTGPVTLSANPSTYSSYTWTNNLGQVVGNNSTLIVNGPFTGNQTYTCTATNLNSCSGSATATISIAHNPYSSLTGATSQCAGNTQAYSIPNFTLGVSSALNWTIFPSNAGAISSSSGGVASVTWNNNIPATGATITASYTYGPSNHCQGALSLTVMPCCAMPTTAIRASGYGASTSSPFMLSTLGSVVSPNGNGNVVTLDGFILVDQNIVFNSLNVQLGPNARITVVNGKTFTIQNNSILKARCGQMWDGIYVSSGQISPNYSPTNMGIIDIHTNCSIQDAKNAIYSTLGGVFRIYDNVLLIKIISI